MSFSGWRFRRSRRRGALSDIHPISLGVSKRTEANVEARAGKRRNAGVCALAQEKGKEMQANDTLKKVGRGAMAVTLAATLAVPTAALSSNTAFAAAGFPDEDVLPGVWYESYIQWAVNNGIISGYPDGTFGPEDNVTRGQVAVMLCRSAGADVADESQWPENKTPWTDVPDHVYYTQAMNWAYEHGVFQGDAVEGGVITGEVRPDDTISREEVAAVIARYAERNLNLDISVDGMDWPENTINQDTVSNWARDTWMWVANTGIMGGIALPDGTNDLAPFGTTTRAMFAKIVTSLVRDVAPNAEQRPDMQIGQLSVWDVTSTTARMQVTDKDGEDITDYCEFSRDGGITWMGDETITALEPETNYTVFARVRGELDSTKWVEATFKTAEESEAVEIAGLLVDVVKGRDSVKLTAVDSVKLEPITEGIEYAVCPANEEPSAWQDSPEFFGLEFDTGYKACARVKATATSAAGPVYDVTFAIPAADVAAPAAPSIEVSMGEFTADGGSFTARATDAEGKDVTSSCEFSLDQKSWQDSPVFNGVAPSTSYTVYGRVKAAGSAPASAVSSMSVTTPSAETPAPGDEQGTVWVQEYELVSRNYTQWVGIGVNTPYGMDMAFYSDDLVGNVSNTPEVMRVQNAFQEYYQEMKNTSLSPNEGSDRLTGTVNRQESFLVEAGGHFETYTNAEEKAELYAYGNSAIDPDRLRVTGYDNAAYFLYTMSDGAQIKTKKAAWEYLDTHSGVKILDGSLESEVLREGYLYSQTPEAMVIEAGGNPNQPWCLSGETILG